MLSNHHTFSLRQTARPPCAIFAQARSVGALVAAVYDTQDCAAKLLREHSMHSALLGEVRTLAERHIVRNLESDSDPEHPNLDFDVVRRVQWNLDVVRRN